MAGSTTRINASIHLKNRALTDALAMIAPEKLVIVERMHAERDVGPRIAGAVQGRGGPLAHGARAGQVMIDLISHSDNGVLQFGDWRVGVTSTGPGGPSLADPSSMLKIKAIRLLGCNTALTTAAQTAMRKLSADFDDKVTIYGAGNVLHARFFDEDGLTKQNAKHFLFSQHDLPPPRDASSDPVVRDAWLQLIPLPGGQSASAILDRLRPETLDEATRDAGGAMPRNRWPVNRYSSDGWRLLFEQLVPELATAPGLLAAPELEALFPADNARAAPDERFHRATILLGGRFVRVYPVGYPAGVIMRSTAVLRLDGGIPVPLPPSSDVDAECTRAHGS